MLKRIISVGLVIVLSLSTLAVTSCTKSSSSVIKVGSKDFTESYILAELYSLALEKNGFKVQRKFNLGGTNVAQAAIMKGDLDLYPEYTGTCLINVLKQDPLTNPDEVYKLDSKLYLDKYKLVLLEPAKASNSQGLAISKKASETFGITTISQLQQNADKIRFASQGAFEENADGMPALKKTYGEFAFKSVGYYDNAIKYELIKNNKADLVVAFTTDGQLTDDSIVLLEDDKHAWPPYNIVPVIRQDTLKTHPKVADILNKISQLLDNETMQKLNAQVDLKKREPADVAKEFFDANFR